MDDFSITNPKSDVRNVVKAAYGTSTQTLLDGLERLSTLLVMGIEEYLRAFSASKSIPDLIHVGRSVLCLNDGDCTTLLFRTIALILEHVPDSNAACSQHAWELLSLASLSLQHAPNLSSTMRMSTTATLAEECLRVILFVVRDDATGCIVSHGFLREVLGTLDWADARITHQCFDITNAVCDKVNFGAPAAAPRGKGTAAASKATVSAASTKNLLSELVDRLIPMLHQLVERAAGMTFTYVVREGALESLGSLAMRAHNQRQPKVVSAVATSSVFDCLFLVILEDIKKGESDRSAQHRIAHCMTVLLHLVSCAPACARRAFLTPAAKQAFSYLLQGNPEALGNLLLDPFGTSRASHTTSTGASTRQSANACPSSRFPDSEHNPTIMALLCLVGALPAIPATAFGKTLPIAFLAVRKWLWEDDVHNFSEYPSDQWLILENALAQGLSTGTVRVRGRSFEVDVHNLKQASGRNICKSFVPEYFALIHPGAVDAVGLEVPIPLALMDMPSEDANTLNALYDEYINMVAEFCPRVSAKSVKSAGMWTVACLVHTKLCLLQRPPAKKSSFVDPEDLSNNNSMTSPPSDHDETTMPLLCEMIVDALSVSEEEAVPVAALALSCMDWLLHNQRDGSSSLRFTTLCMRFGIPHALHVILHFASPAAAQVVYHAELLLSLLEASTSPTRAAMPMVSQHLGTALQAFNNVLREGGDTAASLKVVVDVIANSSSMTSFEFVNAGVAATLVSFLKGMPPANPSFAPAGATGPQTTPVKTSPANASKDESSRKQRCQLLRALLQQKPAALDVLVRKIVGILPFLTPLPLVESTVSAHAVVMRPLNEALAILASLAPRMAMCCSKQADSTYVDQRAAMESDLEGLCPTGHRLYNRIASGWLCDLCSKRGDGPTASMRCDDCDFDVCFDCFRNPEVGYVGGLPDHESEEGIRPGRTFHMLCSVGDVERYFRVHTPPPVDHRHAESGTAQAPPPSWGRGRIDCYYEGIGRCKMHETLIGVMYRKAFARRLTTVLEQFENSLLRVDAAGQQAAARHQQVAAMVSSLAHTPSPLTQSEASFESLDDSSAGMNISSTFSPLRGLMFSSNRRAASYSPNHTPAAARRLVDKDSAMKGVGRGVSIREYGEQCVTKARTYFFHHFHSRSSDTCACAEHTRRDFSTEQLPLLRQKPSPFEQQPEVQILLLLREMFVGKGGRRAPQTATDSDIFPNVTSHELAALVTKSMHASALRVAILPLFFAVPRWVSFIIREAPFLLPLSIREKICRFTCYGARRALWNHIRKLNLCPLTTPGGVSEPIVTPHEWHAQLCHADQQHGHKFKVHRELFEHDAMRILQASSDYRFPISIEFVGDKGTGIGPTVQFYSLIAQCALKPENASRFWRGGRDACAEGGAYIPPAEGIFPDAVDAEDTTALAAAANDVSKTQAEGDQKRAEGISALDASTDDVDQVVIGCITLDPSAPPRMPAAFEDFYYLMGLAMGRSLCDQRVVPLPLSAMMLEWLRIGPPPLYMLIPRAKLPTQQQPSPPSVDPSMTQAHQNLISAYRLGIDDVAMIDQPLARQLTYLRKLGQQGPGREASSGIAQNGEDAISKEVEDMSIFFTLPGKDHISLLAPPSGSLQDPQQVTRGTLAHYVQRVCECVAFESCAIPIRTFFNGFTDVVQHEGLQMLELEELNEILLGDALHPTAPLWTSDELQDVLVADHGYTSDSPPMRFLFDILANNLSPLQQRKFLEFCTGCPRLPLGGIRAVGAITVVRRTNDVADGVGTSSDLTSSTASATVGSFVGLSTPVVSAAVQEWPLPTVNTCFRYLKLPPYPTKELTLGKLLTAIEHCGSTFELS